MSSKSYAQKLEELYVKYSTQTMGVKDLRSRTTKESMCLAYSEDYRKQGELRLNYLPNAKMVCLAAFFPDGKVSTILWYPTSPKEMYGILNRSDFLKMDRFLTDLLVSHTIKRCKGE